MMEESITFPNNVKEISNAAFISIKRNSLLVIIVFCWVGKLSAQVNQDSVKEEKWSYHFQLTAIKQGHPSFKALYSGENSLLNTSEKGSLSITSTVYLVRRLWNGAAIILNPEIAGGSGISSAKGIAGFTNGETFRIGDPSPSLYMARIFLQQAIPLKHTLYEKVEPDANQLAGFVPTSRIQISIGKFDIADYYDDNKYSHDPRTQFMNWALMCNGAWDYPANTRGYTSGIVTELIHPNTVLRLSTVLVGRMANGPRMDWNIFKAHSETIEFEKRLKGAHPGSIRFLAFHTLSQAPTYRKTILETKNGDSSSVGVYRGEQEWKRYGGVKYGFGISADRELSKAAGIFFRTSVNDGKSATWAFTEIDQSVSLGLQLKGSNWKRDEDNIAVAAVINGISKDHRDFLNGGLYGFIIGDGKLNYRKECIVEVYYQARLAKALFASFDYQFVNNPGYNKDRGPVHVFAVRGHVAF